mgnify:CR=1 FL=1
MSNPDFTGFLYKQSEWIKDWVSEFLLFLHQGSWLSLMSSIHFPPCMTPLAQEMVRTQG